MCRIGRRLRSGFARNRGVILEIRPFIYLEPNPRKGRHCLVGSLTGVVAAKSSYRRGGLAPRCRLVTSWGWRRSQGFGCSPIKVARELGSERRETVRSLSVVGVGDLREPDTSTRGPCWTDL